MNLVGNANGSHCEKHCRDDREARPGDERRAKKRKWASGLLRRVLQEGVLFKADGPSTSQLGQIGPWTESTGKTMIEHVLEKRVWLCKKFDLFQVNIFEWFGVG